jgi:hypothetical protein
MTALMILLSRVWFPNRHFSCSSIHKKSVPRGTAGVRARQVADLTGDWLFKLVEEAKRMAPTALVLALRILR